MSGNLKHVREMSGMLLAVREMSGKNLVMEVSQNCSLLDEYLRSYGYLVASIEGHVSHSFYANTLNNNIQIVTGIEVNSESYFQRVKNPLGWAFFKNPGFFEPWLNWFARQASGYGGTRKDDVVSC